MDRLGVTGFLPGAELLLLDENPLRKRSHTALTAAKCRRAGISPTYPRADHGTRKVMITWP